MFESILKSLFGSKHDREVKRVEPIVDEINEFEAQQRDYGTLIVKLYFDVSAETQDQRLAERAADPWRQVQRRYEPVKVADPAYAEALKDLRRNSDTRWSP